MPKEVLLRFEAKRAQRLRALEETRKLGMVPADNKESIERDFHREIERFLDRGVGACYLRQPEIASLVAGALSHFHEIRYVLREWVIMPNHVHVLFWPFPNHSVGSIVGGWKQFSSRRAKSLLGLPEGRFWQPEPFDHWVRDQEERARIVRYIRNNPVKAFLCAKATDWRWSSAFSNVSIM